MPTPFMHLQMAEELLPILDGRLRDLLAANWPAFLLGSIAPDFQVICDIPRENTHFYPIPPAPNDFAAFDRLQLRYPDLGKPGKMGTDAAVFWIGYGIHLLFDLLWDHRVLTPNFRHAEWGTPQIRFTNHNTLLTFYDREALHTLQPGLDLVLGCASAVNRLPFDKGADLPRWQEMIVAQLRPGGTAQTIEIYAGRMGMTPAEFTAQLNDAVWMDDNVFQYASMELVLATLDEIIPLGKTAALRYLAPLLAGEIC